MFSRACNPCLCDFVILNDAAGSRLSGAECLVGSRQQVHPVRNHDGEHWKGLRQMAMVGTQFLQRHFLIRDHMKCNAHGSHVEIASRADLPHGCQGCNCLSTPHGLGVHMDTWQKQARVGCLTHRREWRQCVSGTRQGRELGWGIECWHRM
jgi:hypothetical protein